MKKRGYLTLKGLTPNKKMELAKRIENIKKKRLADKLTTEKEDIMNAIPFCFQLSSTILNNLSPAKPGPRVSKKYDSFYLDIPGAGRFPLRLRFEKTVKRTPDEIYHIAIFHRKRGRRDEKGRGYATDFLEINFYGEYPPHKKEVLTMDFYWFPKNQVARFSNRPEKVWRFEGVEKNGILYAYRGKRPKIYTKQLNREVSELLPLKISPSFRDISPERDNSTPFPKYKLKWKGEDIIIYDRRRDPGTDTALLEIVRKEVVGDDWWLVASLKDLKEVPKTATELLANED